MKYVLNYILVTENLKNIDQLAEEGKSSDKIIK